MEFNLIEYLNFENLKTSDEKCHHHTHFACLHIGHDRKREKPKSQLWNNMIWTEWNVECASRAECDLSLCEEIEEDEHNAFFDVALFKLWIIINSPYDEVESAYIMVQHSRIFDRLSNKTQKSTVKRVLECSRVLALSHSLSLLLQSSTTVSFSTPARASFVLSQTRNKSSSSSQNDACSGSSWQF